MGIYNHLICVILRLYLLGESSEKPDKWFFELIVTLGRNVVVLEVLLSMEGNLFGLHFSVLNINFISNQDNGNVFAYSHQILVPLWNILVGDS